MTPEEDLVEYVPPQNVATTVNELSLQIRDLQQQQIGMLNLALKMAGKQGQWIWDGEKFTRNQA